MRPRLPGRPGLAAVRITEREVDAGHLFILQQDADHRIERDVGAERELADAVAVLIGVAVRPELALQVGAIGTRRGQAAARHLERQRRRGQIAVFRSEVVARRGVADERAVDGRRRREDLARRQIRPVARADEPARLDPGERRIERRSERGPFGRFHAEAAGAAHPLAQPLAQRVDAPVVGAHPLAHDLGRHANHVRVADDATFDDGDDGHAGGELALVRLHAQDADVGAFERGDDGCGRLAHRPLGEALEDERVGASPRLVERAGEARGHFGARKIADERHALAGCDGEADLDGVSRARVKVRRRRSERRRAHQSILPVTTKAGT